MVIFNYAERIIFAWFFLSNIIHLGIPIHILKPRMHQQLQLSLTLNYVMLSLVTILITFGIDYATIFIVTVYVCLWTYAKYY